MPSVLQFVASHSNPSRSPGGLNTATRPTRSGCTKTHTGSPPGNSSEANQGSLRRSGAASSGVPVDRLALEASSGCSGPQIRLRSFRAIRQGIVHGDARAPECQGPARIEVGWRQSHLGNDPFLVPRPPHQLPPECSRLRSGRAIPAQSHAAMVGRHSSHPAIGLRAKSSPR